MDIDDRPIIGPAKGLVAMARDGLTATVHAVTFHGGVLLVDLLAPAILTGASILFGHDDQGTSPGRVARGHDEDQAGAA